jgi:hypothetical protein
VAAPSLPRRVGESGLRGNQTGAGTEARPYMTGFDIIASQWKLSKNFSCGLKNLTDICARGKSSA